MDLALGVAVAGPVARLALIESAADGHGVIDESIVVLAEDPIASLTETVIGTDRSLADQYHRLVATRLCWSDQGRANQLRQALEDSGVQNVVVLPESQAATALVRTLSGDQRQRASAVLLVDDETAMLSIVDSGDLTAKAVATERIEGSDAVTAAGRLLGRLREQPGAAQDVYLIGKSSADVSGITRELQAASSLPLAVPDDPDFAIARGAALDAATSQLSYPAGDATTAAPVAPTGRLSYPAGDATTAAPVAPMTGAFTGAEDVTRHAPAATESGPQLAYSMEDYDSELLPMEYGDGDEYEELDAAAPPVGRALLVGSTVGGILVAGFAALAVAVTIGVRPTAATHPQPPAPAQQKSVPGNFVPALPAPNTPPAPEVQAPPLPAPNAVVPQGGPGPAVGGGGGADQLPPPAPASPPDVGPGVLPPPAPGWIPIPIPIPIPFPHPHPNTTGGTTTGGTTTGGTTG
ncbi:MAG: hypothetical protein QOE52_5727, partial [Mycobacterium sp.]|nr:hypothetical protein [Mycobacterium sp.]